MGPGTEQLLSIWGADGGRPPGPHRLGEEGAFYSKCLGHPGKACVLVSNHPLGQGGLCRPQTFLVSLLVSGGLV